MKNSLNSSINIGRWLVIGVLFISTLLLFVIPNAEATIGIMGAIIVSVFAFWHGSERYGLKNMIILFLITWVISNFFESLSILTGFPFGNYHYEMGGPKIVHVPLIIMPACFAMGYVSYTLAHVLTGLFSQKLKSVQLFIVPIIGAFIMVMWDLVMDPPAATVNKQWIWEDGGNYFGVPISNYFGWFLVVYLFMQTFAIFLAKYDTNSKQTYDKSFWLEAAVIYGIQGLSFIIPAVVNDSHVEIYSSSALICVFTMMFVALLSSINIMSHKDRQL
ncbi:carotenoid biosynthesis protein [Streptococcus thoraltensis]|uniref:carotenoid biosynthesis protein n=1 Tax=Streptococcus thoraltensis TaxID=55085 RepID=UPI001F59FE22|nr:carotenoid biosynthesis protein [Streptococcus thoraltensis]